MTRNLIEGARIDFAQAQTTCQANVGVGGYGTLDEHELVDAARASALASPPTSAGMPPGRKFDEHLLSNQRLFTASGPRRHPELARQPAADHDVDRAAEARPPRGHSGVGDKGVMDEKIEEPMSGDASCGQPRADPEAKDRKECKHQPGGNLDHQRRVVRRPHDGKQRIVGRNDDEGRRVEGAVTVEAAEDGKATNIPFHNHAYEIFHGIALPRITRLRRETTAGFPLARE